MSDEHKVMPAATGGGGLAENGSSPGSAGGSPQAQAGSTVMLHYGTNRNMIGDHDDFGPEFGWAPNDRNYYAGIAQFAPTQSLDDAIARRPAAGGAAITGVKVDPQKMIESFLDEASRVQAASTDPGLQSLVYIHGYAFEFKEVAPIARVVAAGYGSKANLFFSWPSYGSHWRYGDDWDHAYGSGTAVAQFLLDLLAGVAKMAVPPRLSLVCHSMGNRVLSSTIQALDVQTQTKLTRFFDHILLFAPDESYTAIDDARKLQPALAMFKKSMTIYTNQFDVPLQLAKDHPKNKSEELGRKGPATFPILDSSGAVRKDVFWVDCSEVADNLKSTLGHQYYRVVPAVIQDAAAVLSGAAGATIPGRKPDAAVAQKFLIPKP